MNDRLHKNSAVQKKETKISKQMLAFLAQEDRNASLLVQNIFLYFLSITSLRWAPP